MYVRLGKVCVILVPGHILSNLFFMDFPFNVSKLLTFDHILFSATSE